ncbi:MAG: leucine--tRNA ligase [Crocinitomicaceae bacterium]|nr:leucine--tRNA ligase [Crocinitomicaceae bacterium]MBK8927649.1 leucine--tRNA ligase [Crocinitomicaceae bacterium]
MEYSFREIEKKWRKKWADNKTFNADDDQSKPKYYVLDMFPYPSGAGLHVGHPLGYIASDIYARYKRLQGYNVLHPMGYDSFGLPAEQYAIQTGQHPEKTTRENIARYRDQLDKIGFSFDWDREVRTSDPNYYKWTQWIFIQLFNSWYNPRTNKAEKIETLISIFEKEGFSGTGCDILTGDIEKDLHPFTAEEWKKFDEKKQRDILMNFRLTYLGEAYVNWCPALGTVLANDEVKDGFSERGGHPVERKLMKQWSMRITAYAQRLLDGLETIDWSESIKEAQRNWIGRSEGALVRFIILSSILSAGKDASTLGNLPNGTVEIVEEERPRYLNGKSEVARINLHRAKEMRQNPTPAEKKLWGELKTKQLGVKIRQQHLIDKYIVDFVCISKRLVIEVDGDIHDLQIDEDLLRTQELTRKGFKVIRFRNEDVLNQITDVINKIKEELLALPSRYDDTNEMSESISVEDSAITYIQDDGTSSTHAGILPPGMDRGWEIEVFTTRPDTIFGVSFVTLAPEHELVSQITTAEQKAEVDAYVNKAKNRSERERMADVNTISGVFTGAYVIHPFTGNKIQVWVGDYVLVGYGTGAVMAVPAHDERDYKFAKHFGLPITQVIEPTQEHDFEKNAWCEKEGKQINSDFLNGLDVKDAIKKAIEEIEKQGLGKRQINYRLRDAVFGRQRYWGEPIPVYYVNGTPYVLNENELPLTLPEVDKYLPTEDGEPPLARANNWTYQNQFDYEHSTMPGWAGSSWYFLRYMDPKNIGEFVSKNKADYWGQVDLYIGGSEHATGHLLYSRFWNKFLFDLGYISFDEPFKKLINQGMILGNSAYVHVVLPQTEGHIPFTLSAHHGHHDEIIKIEEKFPGAQVSARKVLLIPEEVYEYIKKHGAHPDVDAWFKKEFAQFGENMLATYSAGNAIRTAIDVSLPEGDKLKDLEKLRQWHRQYEYAELLYEGDYICSREVEKMSKSKYNVQTPDELVEKFGADTLRLYEMFLGPLEQAKPWDTQGINGVHNFLRRFWRLFHNDKNEFEVTDGEPSKESLKTLHKTIKKIQDDLERFSFNTGVSNFMIATNEFTDQKCNNRAILRDMLILLSSYAPHIAEELWEKIGEKESITYAQFPKFNAEYLVESSFEYPVSFNGKMRFKLELPLTLTATEIEKEVMAQANTTKYLEGKSPKKIIVVPGKIVNVVM